MLKTRIIPCMLFNGLHLVKTIKFGQMRTLGNPLQIMRVYNSRSVDELIFVDLLATQEKREPPYDTISDLVKDCFIPLAIGGGIKDLEQVSHLFQIGAEKVVINTESIIHPAFITEIANRYGSQSVVVSIDARLLGDEYFVFRERGTLNTGKLVVDWVKMVEGLGAGEIFLTSIDRDGTMEGYDLELIKKVTVAASIPVIAAGGAGKVQDCIDAVKVGGADAISLASMFHYSGHTANSIKERMALSGIPVRLLKV